MRSSQMVGMGVVGRGVGFGVGSEVMGAGVGDGVGPGVCSGVGSRVGSSCDIMIGWEIGCPMCISVRDIMLSNYANDVKINIVSIKETPISPFGRRRRKT